MNNPDDYYHILGVSPYASQEGIRHAYIQKARQFHPDLHPHSPFAERHMATLNVAYETLSDRTRRSQYDQARLTAYIPASAVSYGQSTTVAYSHGSVRHHHLHDHKEPGFGSIMAALLAHLMHVMCSNGTAAHPRHHR